MEISKTRKESNNKGKNYLHVATLATCKIFCILGLLTHRMFCVCECLAYNVVKITPLNLFCIFIDNASRSGPREQKTHSMNISLYHICQMEQKKVLVNGKQHRMLMFSFPNLIITTTIRRKF